MKKVCNDRHIKRNRFEVGGLVLMYDNKFFKDLGKLKMHWLEPYVIKEITYGGAVKLEKLDGTEVKGLVNGIQLKLYFDRCDLVALKQNLKKEREKRENG